MVVRPAGTRNFIHYDAANALVQHLIHALVPSEQEQEDRPVFWQHPWVSARGLIRICRSVEDGTRNAFNGRLGHANGEGANLPVDNIFWFLEQMTIN